MAESNAFEGLLRTVGNLEDLEFRLKYVADTIGRLPEKDTLEVFDRAYRGALEGSSQPQLLFLLLSIALADQGLAEVRELIVNGSENEELVETFRTYPPPEAQGADRVPDLGQGRPLTLGERKTLARGTDRLLITRVINDPNPGVIENLLANPVVTEIDIIRLCAKRPVSPEVLRSVFLHKRWVFRYRTRNALVRNPYCPLDIALQLTATLNSPDLREICSSHALHDLVRLHARSALRSRVASRPP